MRVTEQDVQRHLLCPLLGTTERNVLQESLIELTRWVVFEAFEGRPVSAKAARFKFETMWSAFQKSEGLEQKQYFDGLRTAVTAIKSLLMLVETHKIVQPIMPYQMHVSGGHLIQGEYAIIHRYHDQRTSELSSILMVRFTRSRFCDIPEPVELMRYLHLMASSDLTDAKIYYLPLLKGAPWKHEGLELPLVRKAVDSILRSFEAVNHPRTGPHCNTCLEKKCRIILNG